MVFVTRTFRVISYLIDVSDYLFIICLLRGKKRCLMKALL